ncbi:MULTISPECIES: alpha/beta hydrolase [Listeria]|uniref:alpha/beta hydrolase n=1 Tax=Listeria TaxID=1637 RepID=UPI000B58D396|nr:MULTISPECIES: alpha/beta hydrolase [Listeria]
MNQKTFIFSEKNGLKLAADLITRDTPSAKTVIYFHGGGLLYGTRSDLDKAYIQQFLDGGYNLLLVDYRLAPETKLPEIYEDIQDAILWFEKEATETLSLPQNDFALFGRSAGAFLALLAATDPTLPHPFAVLSFYGYFTVNAAFLHEETAYFQSFPKISDSLKDTMIHPEPIVTGSVDSRYPLYIYARQNGVWQELVFGENAEIQTIDTFDLVPERDFHFLPPLFLAHSFADQDVPISESETLKNGTLESELYTVHNLPHDFDTNTTETDGRLAYEAAIRFLNKIV